MMRRGFISLMLSSLVPGSIVTAQQITIGQPTVATLRQRLHDLQQSQEGLNIESMTYILDLMLDRLEAYDDR